MPRARNVQAIHFGLALSAQPFPACPAAPGSLPSAAFSALDLGPRRGEFFACGIKLLPRITRVALDQALQKFGIGLQARGAPIHLLFGGADFEPAHVLGMSRCDSAKNGRHGGTPHGALADYFLDSDFASGFASGFESVAASLQDHSFG